jgi:hypothetical protein
MVKVFLDCGRVGFEALRSFGLLFHLFDEIEDVMNHRRITRVIFSYLETQIYKNELAYVFFALKGKIVKGGFYGSVILFNRNSSLP